MRPGFRTLVPALAAGLLLISAPSVAFGAEFAERLRTEWAAFRALLVGGRSPLARSTPAPMASPDSEERARTEREARVRRNAELLREIWVVALGREPEDRARFGSLLDSLNQGASLEGVHNGLVHSTEYRRREEAAPAAPPPVREAFLDAWAELRAEIEADRRGLAQADPAAAAAWRERARTAYERASTPTLKRELGDEALRLVAARRARPERLAFWYSRWAARLASRGVDFGLPARNRADADFHYAWALEDPAELRQDQLAWETLNRLHRLLNAAEARVASAARD